MRRALLLSFKHRHLEEAISFLLGLRRLRGGRHRRGCAVSVPDPLRRRLVSASVRERARPGGEEGTRRMCSFVVPTRAAAAAAGGGRGFSSEHVEVPLAAAGDADRFTVELEWVEQRFLLGGFRWVDSIPLPT